METEDDVKTLEERLAQIEEWKKCKDDAEYRAKVKAENEYWEAVENLKQYHKRIENICTLMDKLASYQIYSPSLNNPCDLVDRRPEVGKKYKYYFGKIIRDTYGVNTDHYVLYDNGEFHYCHRGGNDEVFSPSDRLKPETEILKKIYESFPDYERRFYEWLDKKTKI